MITKFYKINILIVDDHYIMRKTLKDMLKVLGYVNVFLAESGNDALEVIEYQKKLKQPIHLIITDWIMEDGSGIELIYKLKTDINYFNIPIMMITGEMSQQSVSRAVQYGADSYLVKPFQTKDIDQSLDALLQKYAYPDDLQQMIFKADKLFLSGNCNDAVPYYIKIFKQRAHPRYGFKLYSCFKSLGEHDKAQKILLQFKDTEFLPILRALKALAESNPKLLTVDEFITLLEKKISFEWDSKKAVTDILNLSKIYLQLKKDAVKAYTILKEGQNQFRQNKKIIESIVTLEKKFPHLTESEEEREKKLLKNRGIKYINDLRVEMRRLNNKNQLKKHIEKLQKDLEYFPDNAEWLVEVGIALIESGENNDGINYIEKGVTKDQELFNYAEISDYIFRLKNAN